MSERIQVWRRAAGVLLALAAFPLHATAARAEAAAFTYLAQPDRPPYEFVDRHGQPVGFNVDLVRAIATAEGLALTVQVADLPKIETALGSGARVAATLVLGHQGLAPLAQAPSHLSVYGRLLLHSDSPSVRRIEEILDAPVATAANSPLQRYLQGEHPLLPLQLTQGVTEAARQVANGTVAYAVVPAASVPALVDIRGLRELRAVGPPFALTEYALAVPAEHHDLLQALRRGLAGLRADGTFGQLETRWFAPPADRYSGEQLRQWALNLGMPVVLVALAAWVLALRRSVRLRTRELSSEVYRRRAAETELTALNQRFELAVSFAQLGIWDRDVHTGQSTWNDIQCRHYGVPPGSSIGLSEWENTIVAEDREAAVAAYRATAEHGDVKPVEFRIHTPDGGIRHLHCIKGVVRDATGQVARIIGINRDVTHAREEQRRLRTLLERDRLAAHFGKLGIWEWDVRRDSIQVNDQVLRIYGLESPPAGLQDWDRRQIHPDDLAAVEASYKQILDGAEEHEMHFRIRRPDGSQGTIFSAKGPVRDGAGNVERIVGVNVDVTRRDAEALRLRALVERDRLAARLGGIGVWEWERATDRLVCSDELLEMAGLPAGTTLTLADWLEDIVADADCPGARACHAQVLAGASAVECTLTIDRSDGLQRQLHAVIGAMTNAEGVTERVTAVLRDVTEEVAAQREIRHRVQELTALNARLTRTQQQLVQTEKLAVVGQLAAGVAHEINNPMAFVRSNLNTLATYLSGLRRLVAFYATLEGCASHEQRVAAAQLRDEIDLDYLLRDAPGLVRETLQGTDRVCAIVQDLRNFARPGTSAPEQADLHAGLESTLNMLASELGPAAKVVREYSPQMPAVHCVAAQINQVFLALLLNAAQAIRGGGTITVSTGHDAGRAWVEIRDTGQGIDAADLPRIFDPFFTTKPVGSGTGMGLALARSIVAQHGGRLTASSGAGRGAVFRLTLPIDPPAHPTSASRAASTA